MSFDSITNISNSSDAHIPIAPKGGFSKIPRVWRPLETILPFLLIGLIYFGARQVASESKSSQTLSVALVQRNFPCVFKAASSESPERIYARLLAPAASSRPDLTVLPESAFCEVGAVDSPRARVFAARVCGLLGSRALLAGGSRQAGDQVFNSAGLYTPETLVGIYDKVHLVPFGEYIPGDKWIPALQALAPVGSCTSGELKTMHCPTAQGDVPIGVAICFEDTDSAQMRRLAKQGARALVFITNDSWFSYSNETVQHAWQAVARAIETGLPVVRCGNSGVTGTVGADGAISWYADERGRPIVDQSGLMLDRVVLGSGEKTPYVRYGDKPIFFAFLLLILGMFMVKYRKHYEKRRSLSMLFR